MKLRIKEDKLIDLNILINFLDRWIDRQTDRRMDRHMILEANRLAVFQFRYIVRQISNLDLIDYKLSSWCVRHNNKNN